MSIYVSCIPFRNFHKKVKDPVSDTYFLQMSDIFRIKKILKNLLEILQTNQLLTRDVQRTSEAPKGRGHRLRKLRPAMNAPGDFALMGVKVIQ